MSIIKVGVSCIDGLAGVINAIEEMEKAVEKLGKSVRRTVNHVRGTIIKSVFYHKTFIL